MSEIFCTFAYMKKTTKILSLFVTLLMVVAAAITVNKSVFGHSFDRSNPNGDSVPTESEVITREEDGSAVVHTAGLPGTIDGYAGEVPLEIHIANGRVKGVKALPNTETPSFFDRASILLSSWDGRTISEADTVSVDAVSGATFSSNAIITNTRRGLAYYEGSEAHRGSSVPLKIWVAFAVTLMACIVPLFVRNRVYHTTQMIANVIVLGFWTGEFLDYYLILKYVSTGFTWPVVLVSGAMLIAAFIYPLFGRPQHYCNHICPLGSAQQLMAQVCGYKIHLSHGLIKGLNLFRRLLWMGLMLLLWCDCLTAWMDLELFQAFQFRSASLGIIIAASFFVLLSTVIARPYCRFVCPTGSLFKRAENIDKLV